MLFVDCLSSGPGVLAFGNVLQEEQGRRSRACPAYYKISEEGVWVILEWATVSERGAEDDESSRGPAVMALLYDRFCKMDEQLLSRRYPSSPLFLLYESFATPPSPAALLNPIHSTLLLFIFSTSSHFRGPIAPRARTIQIERERY